MTSTATFAATYMLFYVCGGGAEGGIVAFYDTGVVWKFQSKLQCIHQAITAIVVQHVYPP